MLKKRYLFLIMIVCLFAISAVSAEQIDNNTNMMENDYDSGLISESVNEDTLGVSLCDDEIQESADAGTFTDLQNKIDDAEEGSTINLENDYKYDSGFSTDGITINKPLTINGNGYTIDALGQSRIFNINSPTVTLNKITFKNGYDDYDGGAVYWGGGSGLLVNSTFVNNYASEDGGAVYWGGGSGVLVNSTFVNNSAWYGGAVYWYGGSNILVNSTFVNNSAENGGAVCWYGVSGLLVNSTFVNNSAWYGGAVYWGGGSGLLVNSTFVNNSASDDGGAVYWDGVSGLLVNSTFVNNSASDEGGALYVVPYYYSYPFYRGNATFESNKFYNNYAPRGISIFLSDSYSSSINNLFYLNSMDEIASCVEDVNLSTLFDLNTFFVNGKAVSKNDYFNNGTFTNLQKKIDDAEEGSIIELENDYVYDSGFSTDGITINKKLTINGNGHVIDALGQSRIFYITSQSVTLNNITFKNGYSDDGGAVYWNGTDGVIANSTFVSNSANEGGAVWWFGGYSVLVNSSFVSNSANEGGAVYWDGYAGLLANSTFVSNSANEGGAVYWDYDAVSGELVNSTFVSNSATNKGGAVFWFCDGGLLVNSSFVSNSARYYGGAVYWDGGYSLLINSSFVNNSARAGGAVSWSGVDGVLVDSTFINNSGGAVSWSGVDGVLVNSSFVNNFGGAVLWDGGSGELVNSSFVNNSGGAVSWSGVDGVLVNSSFVNNSGGAVRWSGVDGVLVNSSFVNNSGGAVRWSGVDGVLVNSSFVNNSGGAGGAVYWSGGSGLIVNSSFVSNSVFLIDGYDDELGSGGAIFQNYGTLEVINSSFVDNSASNSGGAFYCNELYAFDKLTMADCMFVNNSASYAGAIGFIGEGTVNNCTFVNNRASEDGGAIRFKDKGIVNNCNFADNNASIGGAIKFSSSGSIVNNCNFSNNIAIAGGAISQNPGTLEVINSIFLNNKALTTSGGAIAVDSASVTNCTFVNNRASEDGGAISANSADINNCNFAENIAKYGGAISMFPGSVTNCTFTNNYASQTGGAIEFTGIVDNCNFANNSAGRGGCAIYAMAGTPEVKNSNFTGDGNAIDLEGGIVDSCNFINNSICISHWGSRTLEVRYSNFFNNYRAIYGINSGSVTNCTFVNNSASSYGSAIYMCSGSVTNCTFVNNSALSYGGTIYFTDECGVNNCIFVNNSVKSGSGAAIYFYDPNSGMDFYDPDPSGRTVNNCTFVSNNASSYGGAISFIGAGTVNNCTFVNNSAGSGAAIRFNYKGIATNCNFANGGALNLGGAILFSSQGTVENCTFDNNHASNYGGAVYFCYDSKVTNSIFVNNSATYGGAISTSDWYGYDLTAEIILDNCNFTSNTAQGYGGAVQIKRTFKSNVTNCNFVNNSVSSGNGGAVYIGDSANVTNCNFTNNNASGKGGAFVCTATDCTLDYCNFAENTANTAGAVYWTGNDGILKYNNFNYYYHPGYNDYVIDGKNVSVISNINAPDVTKYYGGSEQFVVTLVDNKDNPLVNATINVTIDGMTISKVTNGEGRVFIDLNQPSGEYEVISSYEDFTVTSTVTIKPTISANDVEGDYNNVRYVVYLLDSIGNPLTNGSATFTINSKTYVSNISNGKATLNVGENHGSYVVSVTNPITCETISNIVTVNQVSTVTVLIGVKDIKVGDSLTVTAWVNAISGVVTFNVGSDSQKVDVVNGAATYTISDLSAGLYDVSVAYADVDANYLNSSDTKSFNVYKATPTFNVVANDIDEGQSAIFIIALDSDAEGNVTVGIDSKTYTQVLTEGKVNITVPGLTIGDYPYTVSYSGDEKYDASIFNGKITVIDTTAVLIVHDLVKYYGVPGRVCATLSDSSNKPLVGKNVVFNIRGVYYSRTTNGSGVASLNINLVVGVYDVTVTYQNVSATAKVIVKSASTNTTLSLNKTSDNSVRLTASVSPSRASGNVMFNVSGKIYDGIVNNGQATVDVNNLVAGNYIVEAVYSGDSNYDSSTSNTLNFSVEKSSFNVLAPDVDKYYKGPERFTVNLTDSDNKPVTNASVYITINGNTYIRTTDSNGIASMAINLNPGNYTFTTTASGIIVLSTVNIYSTIESSDIDAIYQNVIFEATFLDTAGKPVSNREVQFKVGSNTYSATTNANGIASVDIDLNAGNYIITTTNPITGETKTNNVVISKVNSSISISAETFSHGATLTADIIPDNPSGEVVFIINGNNCYYEDIINSKAQITLINLNVGNYTARAIFNGDSNHNPSTSSLIIFEVDSKVDTILTAEDVVAMYNDDSRLIAELKDVNGNPISGAKVKFTIGSLTKTMKTYSNGKAFISTKSLAPGDYVATVTFDGDDTYAPASATANVLVKMSTVLTAEDAVVVYQDASGMWVVALKDASGNPISGVKVKLTVGDLTKTMRTLSSGKAYIGTKSLDIGDYDAAVTFDGDDYYAPASATAKVTVKNNKLTTVLTAEDDTVIYADASGKWVVALKDASGNPISGVKVKLTVGDLTKTMRTLSSGKAYIGTKSLDIGDYVATVTFDGDDYYAPASATAKVTVKNNKLTTVLTAEDAVVVCGDASGKWVVALKDSNGNPISGVKVKLTVGDLTKTMRTLSSGKAYIGTKSLDIGDYVATVTFDGDDTYAPASATAKVSVRASTVLTADDIAVVYQDASGMWVVALKDASGNLISGVKVKLTVGDLTKTMRTLSSGKAYIGTKSLDIGDYVATVTFDGDDYYAPASATAKVTVKNNKLTTVLTAKDTVVVCGDASGKWVVTLKDSDGNPISDVKVKLTVGDLTKTMKTYASGKAFIGTKTLDIGDYVATVSFDGDDIYAPSNATAKVVVKMGTVLTADDVVATCGDSSRLIVQLKDTDGNPISGVKVKFKFGDLTKTMNTFSNGKAFISTKSLAPGNYTAVISCAGNEDYAASSATANVIVKQA